MEAHNGLSARIVQEAGECRIYRNLIFNVISDIESRTKELRVGHFRPFLPAILDQAT